MSLPLEVHEQSAPGRIGTAVGVGFAAGAVAGRSSIARQSALACNGCLCRCLCLLPPTSSSHRRTQQPQRAHAAAATRCEFVVCVQLRSPYRRSLRTAAAATPRCCRCPCCCLFPLPVPLSRRQAVCCGLLAWRPPQHPAPHALPPSFAPHLCHTPTRPPARCPAGALMGAVTSNWGDIPVVLKDKPWPALARTGSQMAQYGSTLALVGGTFAAVDVSARRRGGCCCCCCCFRDATLWFHAPSARLFCSLCLCH